MFVFRQITYVIIFFVLSLNLAFSETKKPDKDIKKIESERTLKKMLVESPNDLDLHLRLGIVYLKKKRIDKAISHLKRTNENPTQESLNWSIKAYKIKKNYKEVLRNLKILSTLKPRSPDVKTEIAEVYIELKDYDGAISSFKDALKVYRKHLPAIWGLVNIYEKQKNKYELRLVLNDIIKFFPNNIKAYTKLCQIDYEENLFKPAINSCQKAVFLNPKIASNHVHLGLAFKYTDKKQVAMKTLRKAADQFPKSEFAQFVIAGISKDDFNWEAALKYFERCTKADKKSERCYLGQAEVLLEMQKYKKSLVAYNQACNLNKTNYSKILDAVGKLRQNKKYDWSNKFKHTARNCGIK